MKPLGGGYRDGYKRVLMRRFLHMWLGLYKVEGEGVSSEWFRYLMERFWYIGRACAFVPDVGPDSKTKIWFAPYAPQAWAGNNAISKAQVINQRAVPGYPPSGEIFDVANDQNPMGKVAIGRALPSGLPVRVFFEFYADRIAELQDRIDQNTQQVVLPVVFPTKMNKEQFQKTVETALERKWPFLPVNPEDVGLFSPTPMAGVYVADKLMELKKEWENEARSLIGLDTSADEKRERLTTDEANSNNALINLFRKANQMCLDEFAHNIEYLGTKIKFVPNVEESMSVKESPKGGEEPKDDLEKDDSI